jgi:general L-amino acid transport system permease protein
MLLKHISLLFIPAMIVYWIADTPITWSIPVLKGFNLQGGINFSPEFGALWLATTIYFGAHISEVIRSGILAVPKGQLEASLALGVRPMRTMFLVIMPQAMRIIVPPMANYYINIIKTSTLGVAIGYPDLMSTTGGTSLNITGQAVECLIMVMATFSLFNLITGLFMNWYNAKVTLVER